MGYVWADVAADGFMVWIAHREKIENRGKMQTLVYSMSKLGQICINLLILLGFSGPQTNCAGYESDMNVPCTTNSYVTTRVDPELYQSSPSGWCYQKCDQATFDWDLSIPYVIHFILVSWLSVSAQFSRSFAPIPRLQRICIEHLLCDICILALLYSTEGKESRR